MDYDKAMLEEFGQQVLDRFGNPFVKHKVISITLQYTKKMRARNADTFVRYYRKNDEPPKAMSFGFASYLYFNQPTEQEDQDWYGVYKGSTYPIKDSKAAHFNKVWQYADLDDEEDMKKWVAKELKVSDNWPAQLSQMKGFASQVGSYLHRIHTVGARQALQEALGD